MRGSCSAADLPDVRAGLDHWLDFILRPFGHKCFPSLEKENIEHHSAENHKSRVYPIEDWDCVTTVNNRGSSSSDHVAGYESDDCEGVKQYREED